MIANTSIPTRWQEMVNRELESDEQVQWLDMPVARFLIPSSTMAMLLGLIWTSIAFGIALVVWRDIPAFTMKHFGDEMKLAVSLIFTGIGLLIASSPIWVYQEAKKTLYMATNRRIVLFTGMYCTTIRSYDIGRIQDVHRREKMDGTGDVIFGRRIYKDSEGHFIDEEIAFKRIRNPHQVEQILKTLMNAPA